MAREFNDMSRNGQWGLVGGLCVVILGAFYWFYWAPTAESSATLQTQIATIQTENQRTRAVADQLPQLEAEVESLEANFQTLSTILPEEQETDGLLRRLQEAAADTNLELVRTDYQTEVLHDFYAEVPIQLELLGTFHDLARFFDRVSKFGRIVTVADVSISAVTDGGPNTIQANCTASTFFFLPDAEVAPQDAGATGTTTTTGG